MTTEPVPPGSNLLVEYDPASRWYDASITITAGWLSTGGVVTYNTFAHQPDRIRLKLKRLGLDVGRLESEKLEEGGEKLRILDFYTATLGQKSKERLSFESLKVGDLSILLAKSGMRAPPTPDHLIVWDDMSTLARFNDEKNWVEFMLSRAVPAILLSRQTGIRGIMRGVHSEWVYGQMEGAFDGIIDLRVDESGEEPRSLIRIRVMHDVPFDARWHPLKLDENFQVILEK